MTSPTRKVSPAFEYGYSLGQLKLGIERMFQQIDAGFQAALKRKANIQSDPKKLEALRETASKEAYRRRVAYERDLGLAFVRNETRRVRRELGLDPNDLCR